MRNGSQWRHFQLNNQRNHQPKRHAANRFKWRQIVPQRDCSPCAKSPVQTGNYPCNFSSVWDTHVLPRTGGNNCCSCKRTWKFADWRAQTPQFLDPIFEQLSHARDWCDDREYVAEYRVWTQLASRELGVGRHSGCHQQRLGTLVHGIFCR